MRVGVMPATRARAGSRLREEPTRVAVTGRRGVGCGGKLNRRRADGGRSQSRKAARAAPPDHTSGCTTGLASPVTANPPGSRAHPSVARR